MPDPEALRDELDSFVATAHTTELELRRSELDDDLANRLLRRRSRLLRDLAATETLANNEIARIAGWRDRRTQSAEREIARLDQQLAGYMRAVKARSNGKTKSLKLPNGTLALRSPGRAKREVTNAAVLVEWCQANDHPDWLATTVKPTIGHADLARGELISTRVADGTTEHLFEAVDLSTGARVPGVLLAVRTEDSFYVKPPVDIDLDDEGGEDE